MQSKPNNVKSAEEMIREAQKKLKEEKIALKKLIENIKKERLP